MIFRKTLCVSIILLLCGCAEHIDIAEPLEVPPIVIDPPLEIVGLWERTETFTDTITFTFQDTLTSTMLIERTWITLLEIDENRFVVNFYDDSDGQREILVRREGELLITGDTIEAVIYSLFPRRLLRQSIVRYEIKSSRLILTQIYDSGEDWINRYQIPADIDDTNTGEGIFWLRSAPQGDFDDRLVRELGTFQLVK